MVVRTEESFWKEVKRKIDLGEQIDFHTFRVLYFNPEMTKKDVTPKMRTAAKQMNYYKMYSNRSSLFNLYRNNTK